MEPGKSPETFRHKLSNFADSPFTWGGFGVLAGAAIASPVSFKVVFVLSGVAVAIGMWRAKFYSIVGNFLLSICLLLGWIVLWEVIPKPKEPPTTAEIVEAVSKKMASSPQSNQAASKPELSKPETNKSPTASQIADIVIAQMQKLQAHQSNDGLRGKEHDLAQQIRKMESDHAAEIQRIDDFCASLGKNRGPSCGISQMHEESVAFEKTEQNYRGQAEILRDAILAKLPPQPRPQPDESVLDPNYLDRLAAKLP